MISIRPLTKNHEKIPITNPKAFDTLRHAMEQFSHIQIVVSFHRASTLDPAVSQETKQQVTR